ncbi:MAG: DUF2461 family protein [Cyclobacteriaceae bacterium]|nr:DUF2461 family protein [Cyclobacteriaceae bacterium]
MTIEKSTLDFLKALARNNNREWFQKNKDRYLHARPFFDYLTEVLTTDANGVSVL